MRDTIGTKKIFAAYLYKKYFIFGTYITKLINFLNEKLKSIKAEKKCIMLKEKCIN